MIAAVAGKKLIDDKGKGVAKDIDAIIETFDMAGIEVSLSSRFFLNPPD